MAMPFMGIWKKLSPAVRVFESLAVRKMLFVRAQHAFGFFMQIHTFTFGEIWLHFLSSKQT